MTDRNAISELLQNMLHISRQAAEPVADAICRLQPARVPEGWRDVVQKACNRIKRLALECPLGSSIRDDANEWAGELDAMLSAAPAAEGGVAEPVAWMTDSPYVCNTMTNDKTVADMWRERGWNVAPLGVIATPAPESREADHSVGVNKMVPEAGQREGVEALEICRELVKWCDENNQGASLWFVERARRLASAQQAGSESGEFGARFIDGMGWVIPMRNAIKYAAYIAKGAADELAQCTGSRGEDGDAS